MAMLLSRYGMISHFTWYNRPSSRLARIYIHVLRGQKVLVFAVCIRLSRDHRLHLVLLADTAGRS